MRNVCAFVSIDLRIYWCLQGLFLFYFLCRWKMRKRKLYDAVPISCVKIYSSTVFFFLNRLDLKCKTTRVWRAKWQHRFAAPSRRRRGRPSGGRVRANRRPTIARSRKSFSNSARHDIQRSPSLSLVVAAKRTLGKWQLCRPPLGVSSCFSRKVNKPKSAALYYAVTTVDRYDPRPSAPHDKRLPWFRTDARSAVMCQWSSVFSRILLDDRSIRACDLSPTRRYAFSKKMEAVKAFTFEVSREVCFFVFPLPEFVVSRLLGLRLVSNYKPCS